MNRTKLYLQITERAAKYADTDLGLSMLMDIESADIFYGLKLNELLDAPVEDFMHDIYGIRGRSKRESFPATFADPLWTPRYSVGKETHIKELWEEFGDIPMDPKTECIEKHWRQFPPGTFREDIWHWFESYFGISVGEKFFS